MLTWSSHGRPAARGRGASDGDGTEPPAHPRGGDEEKCAAGHVRGAPYRETCRVNSWVTDGWGDRMDAH
jgi:hypothetical protein